MKQDTLEGKAKTKNGVKRLCFSIICILLEVIFIITIVTRLNEYAEVINLFTRILSGILVLGLYASNKTSSMKMPWVILILIFPIMGVGLYLLIGLNGGTHKMRERYAEIDSKLLPMLPDSQECLSKIKETIPKAGNIASYIQRNSQYPIYQNTDIVYFDENYTGEYPEEAPFTISELEEIYPTASGKSKEDAAYKEAAMQATYELQHGRRGYQALLSHILNVSVTDLKRNYKNLNVSFDLWKGESDAQPYIPDMVQKMKDDGFAYISDGALVVDVKEDTDTKEIPPCMILKSDGASLYNTTDLATIVWRMKDYHPDELIYVVDKRQELYFTQVFRCARKTGLVKPRTGLKFLGFGTMNGKDGKPFKTREGGVMRLQYLLESVNEEMLKKITENQKAKENLEISEEEAKETAKMIALAAIKYGDLSNQASKDYIFDIDRFTSFEGNTGPYILYTIVRIKSILNKYHSMGKDESGAVIEAAHSASEKNLMLALSGFGAMMENAYEETAPHKICSYIYELANAFNSFYHETKIMSEENEQIQKSYIRLLELTKSVLETCIDLLGFQAPERM